MMFKRPATRGATGGALVTTPRTAAMIQLLGTGLHHEGVAFSNDEFKRIKRLYGFVEEPPHEKPSPPPAPNRSDFDSHHAYEIAQREHEELVKRIDKWEDPRAFLQAGADRNALRHAQADGMRLLAWLAKYISQGEDPLRVLIQLASDSGWDVDPADVEWASEIEDERPNVERGGDCADVAQ